MKKVDILKDPKSGSWKEIRRNLITGTLVIGPVVVTLFLLWKSFQFIDGILATAVNKGLQWILDLDFLDEHTIPGLGFVTLIIILIITGYAARYVGVQWIIQRFEKGVNQIPLVNRIYRAIQQISEAILSGRQEVFKKVVLVEYPRKGIYSIGIMTADTGGLVQSKLPKDSISVFLPTTPNPTSGYLLFIPKEDAIILDISVEDALKMIISGGAINYYIDDNKS